MDEELLRRAYGAFNAHNADAALALMQPAVRWPNDNGGFVRGQGGLREYWSRQWKQADPRIEILRIAAAPDGRVVVEVRERLHGRDGALLGESAFQHVFSLRAGLIDSMEIRGSAQQA